MATPISDTKAAGLPDSTEAAAQQMEAAILRQLLSASGAFKPAGVAGGQLRADMFIETLADAVAKGGGIGIARMLEDEIDKTGVKARGAETGPPSEPIAGGFGNPPRVPMRTERNMGNRMISVTRLGGSEVVINTDLIVTVEKTPDTVITLTTGDRIMVRESVEDVVARAAEFRHRVLQGPGVRADARDHAASLGAAALAASNPTGSAKGGGEEA